MRAVAMKRGRFRSRNNREGLVAKPSEVRAGEVVTHPRQWRWQEHDPALDLPDRADRPRAQSVDTINALVDVTPVLGPPPRAPRWNHVRPTY